MNTQKIMHDAQFLKETSEKMKWLLDHNVMTKEEHTKILERLMESYK